MKWLVLAAGGIAVALFVVLWARTPSDARASSDYWNDAMDYEDGIGV